MSDLRALIEAAKTDGPTAAAKTKVWAGVSSAVGGATAAGAAVGSVGAAKMLVLGTLLGAALSVGAATALVVLHTQAPSKVAGGIATPAPATALAARETMLPVLGTVAPPTVPTPPAKVAAPVVNPPPILIDDVSVRPASEPVRRPSAVRAPAPVPVTPPARAVAVDDDALAREASLLADARNALARHDALTALQIVRGLSAQLPARQLIPEEMAVEAQALRELGLAQQASHVDTTLHEKYPDSVLGR